MNTQSVITTKNIVRILKNISTKKKKKKKQLNLIKQIPT